ncbi:MAG TPA: phosphatidate cytidylyltransferase [Mycolicibacillus parakoreensis]|nr:phosphatidate cytidylyltransferase [Mycolicibacillus parakoreensis]
MVDSVNPPAGQQNTSRAGRNLPVAITVGVALAGMLVATLVFAPVLWIVVLAIATPIATHEVVRRLREGGYDVPFIPLAVGGQAMIWLAWPFDVTGVLGAFGATVVLCMVWRLVDRGLTHTPVNYLRDVSATVMLAAWVPLFMAFGVLLIFHDDGTGKEFTSGAVFCLLFAVVLSDVGGYTAGVLFGKHPMVPAISPKKSWEGLAGSLLFGVTGAVVAVTYLLPGRQWWVGLPLGVLLVLTGTLGDLVESQIKRDLGIKDMGRSLPGHGGMMDRLDGLLPAAVVTWIVLTVLH